MRRVIVAAAVVLLTVALYSEAFSTARPYGFCPPQQGGEDHTWGGEVNFREPTIVTVPSKDPSIIVTGILQFDVFFNTVFMEWLSDGLYQKRQGQPTTYYIITKQSDDQANPETSETKKGNQ